jgi:hypothetical protein
MSSLFEVEANTWARCLYSPGPTASAIATNQIQFSPLMDATQTVGLRFFGWNEWYYSAGSVRLFDATAGVELWNYGWEGQDRRNVPWIDPVGGTDWRAAAALNPETDFLASHQYELTMYTVTGANHDDQRILIQLTGLEVIPEPSTTLLLAVCGAALVILRRRK